MAWGFAPGRRCTEPRAHDPAVVSDGVREQQATAGRGRLVKAASEPGDVEHRVPPAKVVRGFGQHHDAFPLEVELHYVGDPKLDPCSPIARCARAFDRPLGHVDRDERAAQRRELAVATPLSPPGISRSHGSHSATARRRTCEHPCRCGPVEPLVRAGSLLMGSRHPVHEYPAAIAGATGDNSAVSGIPSDLPLAES